MLAGKKVLVVDDDWRTLVALSAIFEQWNMLVETASDGAHAIEILKGCSDVDLVLMDIAMPKLDGCQAIGILRNDLARSDLPILVLTARGSPEIRAECLAAGCNDYMIKPVVNLGALYARMAACLRR